MLVGIVAISLTSQAQDVTQVQDDVTIVAPSNPIQSVIVMDIVSTNVEFASINGNYGIVASDITNNVIPIYKQYIELLEPSYNLKTHYVTNGNIIATNNYNIGKSLLRERLLLATNSQGDEPIIRNIYERGSEHLKWVKKPIYKAPVLVMENDYIYHCH